MKSLQVKKHALFVAFSILSTAGSSFALETWDFVSGCNNTNGKVNSCSGTGISAAVTPQMTGLSNAASTTTSGGAGTATFTNGLPSSVAGIYDWGTNGLGVVNAYENTSNFGPHAIDNRFGTDAILFNFGSTEVNLKSLKIGWNGTDDACENTNSCNTTNKPAGYNDSDLSVFAWVGVGGPTTLTGTTLTMAGPAGLVAAGWKLVGNYADVGRNDADNNTQVISAVNANTSELYSSYWLISAYNTSYGSTISNTIVGTTQALNGFNDQFKLTVLTADVCAGSYSNNQCFVPEPSGLALLGLGLVGLLTTQNARRRRVGSVKLVHIS